MVDIDQLIAEERLPSSYHFTIDQWWRPLAMQIAHWHAEAGRPLIIGVNGAQGSGKSTLCRFLTQALLPDCGLSAITISLDDLYLPLAERKRLALDIHPLFRTRGVPGTHDVAAGMAILDRLVAGHDTMIPRFSKAKDDRLPPSVWARHVGRVDVILFEGWCVGARPQDEASLALPVNTLESQDDPTGKWRRHVNSILQTSYAPLFSRIDRLIMLKPPSFEDVLRNRLLQEHKLRMVEPNAAGIMDDAAVQHFISHYERLTRHMFADLPSRADIIFHLDASQNVTTGDGLTN